MSDRLWLGPEPMPWADANLADEHSMEEAILDFQWMPGPLKVSGPDAKIVRACQLAWHRGFLDDESKITRDPDFVTYWRVGRADVPKPWRP